MGILAKFMGWTKEVRNIMTAVALIAAGSALYQEWTNPYTAQLWVSFFVPNVQHSNSRASAPAPFPSPERHPIFNSSNQALALGLLAPLEAPPRTGDGEIPIAPVVNSRVYRDAVNKGANANAEVPNKSVDLRPATLPSNSRHRSVHSKKSEWFVQRHQELLLAKRQIENCDRVMNDPDLYWPLYRNVSTFKKSYELMEKIFKVYVYQDGQKPYVHAAELKGIYASEGWFIKLMGENRRFVVKDPKQAHMFYLPYSVYELVQWMYVPNSHNMRPLALFLKDYVNMIAAKYPFWNRTQGADHFFVACHDWGPYTTREHPQLRENAIKVLCNADLSEGYFVMGKDVSLPEITLRNVKHPTRHLGGFSASQRPILAFFAGNMHGRVRPVLLQHWKDKDDDMKIYELLPFRIAKKMSYIEHMKSSKYCICPMGYEVNSPRIVEAIYYGCVPVIIADNFVHPFNEVLDWNAFSITVAEKDIPKLKDILLSIPLKKYFSMQLRVKKVQRHFLWNTRPVRYDMFHMILHSVWFNRLNQIEP